MVVPPFLSPTLSSFIRIALDTVSVSSGLPEFTIYVPPYHSVIALVYNLILRSKNPSDGWDEPYVGDSDFVVITEGNTYTQVSTSGMPWSLWHLMASRPRSSRRPWGASDSGSMSMG